MKHANIKLFTLVHHVDHLLATVLDSHDWKTAVEAECKRAGITLLEADAFEEYNAVNDYDPNVFSIDSLRITTGQVLTDYRPDDSAKIAHVSGSDCGGQIVDPDGREWRFARNFSQETDPVVSTFVRYSDGTDSITFSYTEAEMTEARERNGKTIKITVKITKEQRENLDLLAANDQMRAASIFGEAQQRSGA